MRKLIFLFIPFVLFAQPEGFNISANELSFDKNNLHFENGFYLDHSFGKIYANKAQFFNVKKISKLVDFELKDNVKLITNTNAILTSDEAFFNALTSKIQFFSNDVVTFKDKIKNKDLKITSKKVLCHLDTKNVMKTLNFEDIYSISFMENTILSLENKMNIFAHLAIFEKKENSANIYLYPKENDVCKFTYEQSEILAKTAKLDVNNIDICLTSVNGHINNLVKKEHLVSFICEKLFWHNFENSFSLNEDVKVIDPTFGEIFSDHIEIIKKPKENAIRKIISRKNTKMNFFTKNRSSLATAGIIELDHEKKRISAFSLKNQNHDLIYEDENICISAKKAILNYAEDKNIEYITLENNVKFKYKENKNLTGYGLADRIEYVPNENKIVLQSDADKKVLFWQEDNSLKLSANEIHINPKEKKDIKGLGDVRFTFNLEEENLIHEIFSKYANYE